MKILVCGASGFMGNNLVQFFRERGEDVYGVCHTNYPKVECDGSKMFSCDLTSKEGIEHVFKGRQYDVIIQAAATTSGVKDILEKPYIHVTDSVIMNSLLLRAAYDYNVKYFIFLSCGVMYQPGDTPKKETDFNISDEIYPAYFGGAWMKIYTEKQMEFYSRLGRTKHISVRHSNTYGPHDKYDADHSHVFGATVRKVMEATDKVSVWGGGTETARDLIYVKDVCRFIENALDIHHMNIRKMPDFDIVNVSLGKFVTVKELVEKIITASGKNLTIEFDTTKPVIPTKLCLNNEKAYQDYSWWPTYSLEDGIKETIAWYKQNIGGL